MRAAEALVGADAVRQVGPEDFAVKSQSGKGEYAVNLETCVCECRDFQYRGLCKHLVATAIHAWGEERARVLLDCLERLKFERDLAVSQIQKCGRCGGQTKLLELVKLPLPVQAVEVYNARVKCEQCRVVYTVSVPTKRRAGAA